jgi:ABC-2 type transport system permease protein
VGLLVVQGTRITPSIGHALVYLLSIQLSFLIRFMIAYCIGLIAFWWEQAVALDELYFTVAAFLTGSFAPLDLYPLWAQQIIEWTPFPYVIYYPVQILNGTIGSNQMLRVLGVQLVWVVGLVLARQLLWRRGLRRYGAVGA